MSDDSISRQAAIKQAEKESQVDGAYGYMDTKSIVDLLEDLPSIDAPEIVRCKNCRYNPDNPRPFYDDDPVETYAWCKTEYFGEQGFCSCGKPAINLQ